MRTHILLYGGAHKPQVMASPQYYDWINKLAKVKGWRPKDMISDPTYDYEVFYKKYPNEARRMLYKDKNAHFRDIGKTAYHPTFSTESEYSGKINSRHNPLGIIGGTWSDSRMAPNASAYTLSESQLKNKWDVGKTIRYMEEAEDNGVELFYPNGGRPIDKTGTIWGGVLPNIEVISNRTKQYNKR